MGSTGGIRGVLSEGGHVDLSENLALTLELIEVPWRWRQRAVETFHLESGTDVRVTTSYQVEFPPKMLKDFGVAGAESANVILPVTTRQKRPLLRFDISTSHGAPAHVLLRRSIASIEASYVKSLATNGPVAPKDLKGLTDDLLEAMFVFTPQLYKQRLEAFGRAEAVRVHLESEIGLRASSDDVQRWLAQADRASELILRVLDEPPDELSSTENVLLGVSLLGSRPASVQQVDEIVEGYLAAVTAASEASDTSLLAAIGEYGRRWEMLVEVELPLLRPTEIKVAEDRPLEISASGWICQAVAVGEAMSAHVQFAVLDQAVEIDDYSVRTSRGQSIGFDYFNAVRYTRDSLALYTSEPERPFFVEVGIRLRSARFARWSVVVAIIVILSAAVAVAVAGAGEDLVERLTLLALPTTVGGTIVLIREQSGLATTLNRRARSVLAIALLLLWVVLMVRVFNEGVLPYAHDVGRSISSAIEAVWRAVT